MKTFKIYAKHSDLFSLTIAENGEDLKEIDGYSPGDENISICSSSDDLDFEVDIETGKILNWDKARAMAYFSKTVNPVENTTDDSFDELEDGSLHDPENSLERQQARYDANRPVVEQRLLEDNEYYKARTAEIRPKLLGFSDKFKEYQFNEDTDCVFSSPSVNQFSGSEYSLYVVYKVAIILMTSNIAVKTVADGNVLKLYVNGDFGFKARSVLRSIGVYNHDYSRRADDATSLRFKF